MHSSSGQKTTHLFVGIIYRHNKKDPPFVVLLLCQTQLNTFHCLAGPASTILYKKPIYICTYVLYMIQQLKQHLIIIYNNPFYTHTHPYTFADPKILPLYVCTIWGFVLNTAGLALCSAFTKY